MANSSCGTTSGSADAIAVVAMIVRAVAESEFRNGCMIGDRNLGGRRAARQSARASLIGAKKILVNLTRWLNDRPDEEKTIDFSAVLARANGKGEAPRPMKFKRVKKKEKKSKAKKEEAK